MACVADKEENIARYTEKVRELAAEGAQIVCLQELFASLYFCDEEKYQNFKLAEAVPEGPTCQHFMGLAKELGIVLVCSLFEKRAEGLYHNTTAGYKVFKTKFATIGVLICWDQWYPEAARITSLMGAEMLFFPTAIGWDVRQNEHDNREQYEAWQTIQRSHAVANGVPVISVNRTGLEGGMQFWGGSFITNAFGRVLYQAPHLEEALHVEELDLEESDHYRRHWPYYRDRRIDSYAPILKRYID